VSLEGWFIPALDGRPNEDALFRRAGLPFSRRPNVGAYTPRGYTRSVIRGETLTPGEVKRGHAGNQWRSLVDLRRWTPWDGRGTRGDWVLLGVIAVVVAFGAALRVLRPFLIASHPVLLEFLDGGFAAIGAGAAFARIGDVPLWLVVLAGALGMAKFTWLTWWAGRRWGRGLLGFFMTSERAASYTERVGSAPRWVLCLAVVVSPLPGVPSALVCALAGWARMRLVTFVLLNLTGVLIITAVVAGVGFALGQAAVNVVLLIDKYAGWVSLSLIALAVLAPLLRSRWKRLRTHRRSTPVSTPR
jgi:membrane protein DedA with SNARE-associated domain